MESPSTSVSTVSSFGEYFAHIMWNPFLELLISRADKRRICSTRRRNRLGPNCTFLTFFVLDLLCYQEGGHDNE